MASKTQEHVLGRQRNYSCTECGKPTPKGDLTAKRIDFSVYGHKNKRLRTRTVARLCPTCRDNDPAWNRPPYSASPGFDDLPKDT